MRRLLLIVMLALSARAAERGKLVENVATRLDPSQSYTLYLPTAYDPAKKHPLLLVLDPRGRATTAAEIFREAAEEHGWIVMSSNGTRSDESWTPNEKALRALMPEISRYAADPQRIYATGFSGTALAAWLVGIKGGALAGVIGVGGRLVDELPPSQFSFAHFGFAGDTDFNNRDMRVIDAMLEKAGKTHRFESFAGEHRWISPALARDAIVWMELMAMKEQRRARDEKLIADAYARDVAAAAALPKAAALRRYRAISRTFEGLHDVAEAREQILRLERDAEVLRELKAEERADSFEANYVKETMGGIPRIFGTLRQSEAGDPAMVLLREFRIGDLQRRAKQQNADGAAARRVLAAVDSQMSFYLTRDFFARREYRFAIAALTVADTIRPGRPTVFYNLAAAHARLGDRKRALDFLAKSIDAGYQDAKHLASDDDLASLRNEARFAELLKRIQ